MLTPPTSDRAFCIRGRDILPRYWWPLGEGKHRRAAGLAGKGVGVIGDGCMYLASLAYMRFRDRHVFTRQVLHGRTTFFVDQRPQCLRRASHHIFLAGAILPTAPSLRRRARDQHDDVSGRGFARLRPLCAGGTCRSRSPCCNRAAPAWILNIEQRWR